MFNRLAGFIRTIHRLYAVKAQVLQAVEAGAEKRKVLRPVSGMRHHGNAAGGMDDIDGLRLRGMITRDVAGLAVA